VDGRRHEGPLAALKSRSRGRSVRPQLRAHVDRHATSSRDKAIPTCRPTSTSPASASRCVRLHAEPPAPCRLECRRCRPSHRREEWHRAAVPAQPTPGAASLVLRRDTPAPTRSPRSPALDLLTAAQIVCIVGQDIAVRRACSSHSTMVLNRRAVDAGEALPKASADRTSPPGQ
jgi:hypothetical protein